VKVPITHIEDTPENNEPNTAKRRYRSHPLLVALLLVILVLLAGAAAVLGYSYYFQKPAVAPTENTDGKNTDVTTEKALSAIRAVFPSKPSDNPTLHLPIKVAGYNYFTQIDSSHVKGVEASVPYTDSAIATAKIAKALKEKQFTESIIEAGSSDSEYVAHYTNSDVVCGVTATKTANNPTGKHMVAAACANMNDYSVTAHAQKPFYDAYPNKPTDTSTNILFVGAPTLSPSQTAGYQTANLMTGGVLQDGTEATGSFTSMFYQTPDKKWHFFKSAEDTLPCSDYVNDDVKKAYAGAQCLDSSGATSTVSL
jgi:hypothetical protein